MKIRKKRFASLSFGRTLFGPFLLGSLLAVLFVFTATSQAQMLEAEDGVLNGLSISTTRPDYSGTGYVTGFISGTDESLELVYNAPEDGLYSISFVYAAEFGEKFTQVSVNGSSTGEWVLPDSVGFATVGGPVVSMNAGANTITVFSHWGYYDIDALLVEFVPATGSDYEAENGILEGVNVDTARSGYSGSGYVTGFDDGADAVTLLVNLELSGPHQMTIRYASPYGDKNTRLFVDGVEQGEITLPLSTEFVEIDGPSLMLEAGAHTVRFENNWGYYDLDRIDLDFVLPPVGTQFEAETGTLNGTLISTDNPGYSGTGYVTDFTSPDDSVDVPINVAESGNYRISLVYNAPFGSKFTRLFVNGTDYGQLELVSTETFDTVSGPIASLGEGLNVITVASNWGYYEIDRIDLELIPPPTFKITHRLVDESAAPETKKLYKYLRKNFGKYILSGQTEEPTGTPETWHDYIADVTGKLPAIRNLDFLPFTVVDGWDDGSTDRSIHWHRDLGGIVTYTWHWFAPPDGYIYSTDSTDFDVEKAIDPTQPEYDLIIADIDHMAKELGRLAANRVPILFRPLHEADGGWFWWGAKGPEPAKALYRIMFDRLTNYHGLHNLIWVWNSVTPSWYPGNDYVDIVSVDIYRNPHDHVYTPSPYLDLAELSGNKKIIALAENGTIPDIDMLNDSSTLYSWFDTWWGEWITEDHNSVEFLNEVFHHEKVITLDELDDLRASRAPQLFAEPDFVGEAVELPAGIYDSRALEIRGIIDGDVDSIRLPRKYIMLVRFEGKWLPKIYTKDSADIDGSRPLPPVTDVWILKSSSSKR